MQEDQSFLGLSSLGGLLLTLFSNKLPDTYQQIGLYLGIILLVIAAIIQLRKNMNLIPIIVVSGIIFLISSTLLVINKTDSKSLKKFPYKVVAPTHLQMDLVRQKKLIAVDEDRELYKYVFVLGIKNISNKTLHSVHLKLIENSQFKKCLLDGTQETETTIMPGSTEYFEFLEFYSTDSLYMPQEIINLSNEDFQNNYMKAIPPIKLLFIPSVNKDLVTAFIKKILIEFQLLSDDTEPLPIYMSIHNDNPSFIKPSIVTSFEEFKKQK
jgi:hypothetical protein